MLTTMVNNTSIFGPRRNVLKSKWNLLFDKDDTEWLPFEPKLGSMVYACYSCKQMFSSKGVFLDHINRRTIVLKYTCTYCDNISPSPLTFYNRCSLLLHTRNHYQLEKGEINLNNLETSFLPVELAGFLEHPNVNMLFNVADDMVEKNTYINPQFYAPDNGDMGKEIINMKPKGFVHRYLEKDKLISITLKQISLNITRCEFISIHDMQQLFENHKSRCILSNNTVTQTVNNTTEVKVEPAEAASGFTMPIISKIESLNEAYNKNNAPTPKTCTECYKEILIGLDIHFLGLNKPLSDRLKCQVCRFIAPTECSLKAHKRVHTSEAPFVCPECGQVFETWALLKLHMDDACFHLAKLVRYRCPGKKCGKLFAQTATFMSHFVQHIVNIYQCMNCKDSFYTEFEFQAHTLANRSTGCSVMTKLYKCTLCPNQKPITDCYYNKHINSHVYDTNRCMYIYLCKFCRSHFRSTHTYSIHTKKCLKVASTNPNKKVPDPNYTTSNCSKCNNKIVFRSDKPIKVCSTCFMKSKSNMTYGPHSATAVYSNMNKTYLCILCNQRLIWQDKLDHMRNCKFAKPKVILTRINTDNTPNGNLHLSSSSSDVESRISPQKLKDREENKRKRKKTSNNNAIKSKKINPSTEGKNDMQADEPIKFNGTYYCRLCDFNNTSREDFHKHIVAHRDISTAYQCMECGECFVVKPSLIKHLLHFHNITDYEAYLNDNDCFDKDALKELKETMKLAPGESKEPTKQNQCRVCRKEFENAIALDKHFRMHGMAFLMNKTCK